MDERKVAAHFVAFTFFLNRPGNEPGLLRHAGQFARRNWQAFLPCASEELGRFLTEHPREASRKVKPARRVARKAADRQLAEAS
jgi:hypothetical protein